MKIKIAEENTKSRIDVAQSFLPPRELFNHYIDGIWNRKHLTNQGPLVIELNNRLRNILGIMNFEFVANGTIALQLALQALNIDGDVITTPFSYVATVSSILWQKCHPIFVDIEENTFCIDPKKIEERITPNTQAIMGVHVFGLPCDIEAIQKIADQHNLKVIYDGAHAFGAQYKGKSLLSYGDISTCSFHATKLYHTIEGGAVFIKNSDLFKKLKLIMRFGHNNDDHYCLGINAKNSEFHAAMGLSNLDFIEKNIENRKKATKIYNDAFSNCRIFRPVMPREYIGNYGYYPIVLESEEKLFKISLAMNKENIYPRRYFFPSLNTLPYVLYQHCPISESIAKRILCLPLHQNLTENDQSRIIEVFLKLDKI